MDKQREEFDEWLKESDLFNGNHDNKDVIWAKR